MQGIHLYHYFLSNCSQRVCIALEEKGLDWTPHSINLFLQENASDEYFRINPRTLVPAMVHDGVVITESIDILRYIEEHFPEPALYPPGEAERRKVDEWMNLATENHTGVVNFRHYPNIRRWGAQIMQRPSFQRGVTGIQPWYASLMCLALKIKSWMRRRGPGPLQPRLAV